MRILGDIDIMDLYRIVTWSSAHGLQVVTGLYKYEAQRIGAYLDYEDNVGYWIVEMPT